MIVALDKLLKSMSPSERKRLGVFLEQSSRKSASAREIESHLQLSLALALRRTKGQA